MRQAAGLLVSFMLCSPPGGAEEPAQGGVASVGSRVRITSSAANEAVIGTIVRVEVDAVVLRHARSDAVSRIPISDISALEVSSGRRSQAGRGALAGAAAGVVPGLLLTFGDYSSDVHGDNPAATVAVIGAASGALLGAAIGWALKTERWVPSEAPRASLAAVPLPGGVAVSFRMAWGDGAN